MNFETIENGESKEEPMTIPSVPSGKIIELKSFTEDFENFQNSNVEQSVPLILSFVQSINFDSNVVASRLYAQTIEEHRMKVLVDYSNQMTNMAEKLSSSPDGQDPFVKSLTTEITQLSKAVSIEKKAFDKKLRTAVDEYIHKMSIEQLETLPRELTAFTRYYKKVWKIMSYFTNVPLYNFLKTLDILGLCIWATLTTFIKTAFLLSLFPLKKMKGELRSCIERIVETLQQYMTFFSVSVNNYVFSNLSVHELVYRSFSVIMRRFVPKLIMYEWQTEGNVDKQVIYRIWNEAKTVNTDSWELFKVYITTKVFGTLPIELNIMAFEFMPLGSWNEDQQGVYRSLIWPFDENLKLKTGPVSVEMIPWTERSLDLSLVSEKGTAQKMIGKAREIGGIAAQNIGGQAQKIIDKAPKIKGKNLIKAAAVAGAAAGAAAGAYYAKQPEPILMSFPENPFITNFSTYADLPKSPNEKTNLWDQYNVLKAFYKTPVIQPVIIENMSTYADQPKSMVETSTTFLKYLRKGTKGDDTTNDLFNVTGDLIQSQGKLVKRIAKGGEQVLENPDQWKMIYKAVKSMLQYFTGEGNE
jgi:hypothetical protein